MSAFSLKKNRVILLPLDGSENSERAFDWYAKKMFKQDDKLVLVTIVEPVSAAPPISTESAAQLGEDSVSREMNQIIDQGKSLTQRFLHAAKSLGISATAFIHIDSKPGPAIVNCCREHQVDIIIMGNRGVSKLRRTFLGSVSDYVLQHSHTATVIVPRTMVSDDQ